MPYPFKQLTPILTLVGALTVTGLASFPAQAQNKGDDTLLEMAQAFRKNDKARLSALLAQARGHVLEPLAAYWELRPRLDTAPESEIRSFLSNYAGTYYEDRLRTDWLLQLGKRRDWANFTAEYPNYRMRDDREVRCYALVTEAINSKANVADEAKRLWYSLREADDGCTYVAEHLHSGKQINGLDLWRKARMAMDANRPKPAKDAVDIEAPRLSEQVALIHADPTRYLDKRIIAITKSRKELATLALIRLAASDPEEAAERLDKHWGLLLSAEERNWTWAVIGKQAAQKLQDNASSYFANVRKDADLNDDLLGWKVRAALRMGQWKQVLSATQAMSPEARKDATWTYWQARALLATAGNDAAQKQEAQNLLRSIASVRGFYEQLALEELGQNITVPERPAALTAQEKATAQANPGLQRALYAISIGLRAEGNREWNYSTNLHSPGGMNDRELLAAADLACQRQVWDRCINTSERTKDVIDFEQRFPMPLRDIVVRRAGEVKLDPAYVYGLIRQESRFIMDARSGVGASGLMQVMPATAKWTAKKIGMTSFTPEQITDKEVNVAIGTGYLKLVLSDFEGSMAMAAAAYNAGPNRPRNWRNGPVLEAAIWAENVPFQETRDYVKKVLSNTTNYAAILTRQPQSLKSRLGQVGPRNSAQAEPNPDLP
ncbi:lytic transglycosylase domain-containing protein [Limnohabitans sp. Jir72]|uniref:lytic transglycosylase domain-containing protein n=1 Tax=Limnohabitans sp. Jir72 TaxID=1977909 RepID=UPI000D348C16|nr:lytic transglycosylase domain-containing protein [Limnohabitans sp. Jir72]PUE29833.1 lytic transglycosylase [Limnohabitans sp. Jir72]